MTFVLFPWLFQDFPWLLKPSLNANLSFGLVQSFCFLVFYWTLSLSLGRLLKLIDLENSKTMILIFPICLSPRFENISIEERNVSAPNPPSLSLSLLVIEKISSKKKRKRETIRTSLNPEQKYCFKKFSTGCKHYNKKTQTKTHFPEQWNLILCCFILNIAKSEIQYLKTNIDIQGTIFR